VISNSQILPSAKSTKGNVSFGVGLRFISQLTGDNKTKTPLFIHLKARGCGASQTIYESSSPISPIWGLKEGHLLKYY